MTLLFPNVTPVAIDRLKQAFVTGRMEVHLLKQEEVQELSLRNQVSLTDFKVTGADFEALFTYSSMTSCLFMMVLSKSFFLTLDTIYATVRWNLTSV